MMLLLFWLVVGVCVGVCVGVSVGVGVGVGIGGCGVATPISNAYTTLHCTAL